MQKLRTKRNKNMYCPVTKEKLRAITRSRGRNKSSSGDVFFTATAEEFDRKTKK
jgi:hypothetical protein